VQVKWRINKNLQLIKIMRQPAGTTLAITGIKPGSIMTVTLPGGTEGTLIVRVQVQAHMHSNHIGSFAMVNPYIIPLSSTPQSIQVGVGNTGLYVKQKHDRGLLLSGHVGNNKNIILMQESHNHYQDVNKHVPLVDGSLHMQFTYTNADMGESQQDISPCAVWRLSGNTNTALYVANTTTPSNFECTVPGMYPLVPPIDPVNPPIYNVNPPLTPVVSPILPLNPPLYPVNPPILPLQPVVSPLIPLDPPLYPVNPPLIPVNPPGPSPIPVNPPIIPIKPEKNNAAVVALVIGLAAVGGLMLFANAK